MGKSTISMAIFNSYVKLPEGNSHGFIRRKIRKGNQPRIHGLELQKHRKAVCVAMVFDDQVIYDSKVNDIPVWKLVAFPLCSIM